MTLLAERAKAAGAEIRLNSTVIAADADGTLVTANGEARKANEVGTGDSAG